MVPDILKEGAFDAALKDVIYVLHIASPLAKQVRTKYESYRENES